MKNLFKVFGVIAFVAIIGFSMTACDDASGTHTHEWGAWQSNSTQHWKECSCGEEYGRASHVGNPCSVCGYNTLIGTYGYTSTGNLTITFRNDGTFVATRSAGNVNGTYTVSGNSITLSEAFYGLNWTIIDSTTVQDGSGDNWKKR
jgi:hypothetical protein